MFINRPSFLPAGALGQGKSVSAYGSGDSSPVRQASKKDGSDLASASNLALLAVTLRDLSNVGGGRVEQLKLAYSSGRYEVNLGSLAEKLADRISSGLE